MCERQQVSRASDSVGCWLLVLLALQCVCIGIAFVIVSDIWRSAADFGVLPLTMLVIAKRLYICRIILSI